MSNETIDQAGNAASRIAPPTAPRRPHEIEAHGEVRVDDWYWLREKDNPEVISLLEAENQYTKAATAHFKELEDELYEASLRSVLLTDVTYPTPIGPWAYYERTVEGRQYGILCRRPAKSAPPVADPNAADSDEIVLLDENQLAEGHDYFELSDTALSAHQGYLAYACDYTGGERLTTRIRDLEASRDLPDVIENAYVGLGFSLDCSHLFYTRPDEAMRPFQVWAHRLGTDSTEDRLVWQEDDARFELWVDTTKDHRYLVLEAKSSTTSEIRLIPSEEPTSEPFVVVPRQHGVLYSLEHHAGDLLIRSNDSGINFGLYRCPVTDLRRESWTTLLAERADVLLADLDVVDGFVFVYERGQATTAVRVLPLGQGAGRTELLEAPPAGHIALGGNSDFGSGELRFETTTLVEPRTLHSLDLETGETKALWRQEVPGYDAGNYRTERRWAVSQDGTKVPLTIAWRADRPAEPGPCLLYGYGSYGHSMDPTFRTDRPIAPLLDRGVLYAVAHIRGGGEMSRTWYLDGKLENKHHTFEDFVACGRYLVSEGLTEPAQLTALGGSAGGLLVGASTNLDPSLFAAVVAEVPFVDCLTTMLDPTIPLTVAEYEEWGDPSSSREAYDDILAYSPYDNVRADVEYPRILATTGINDARVGFFEPTKWVQKLRAASPLNRDRVLLRVEMSAGHFGPSGRYSSWRKRAFVLAFLLDAVTRRSPEGSQG